MAKGNSPNRSEKLTKILKFLAYRARSEKEIRGQLAKYQASPAEVTQILTKLRSWQLVNDVEFAKIYIESRSRSRPRSRRLLELELRRKGVTINDDNMTMNDYQLAQLALAKKPLLKSRDQVVRFLQSRGFSWEIITKVLKLERDF